MENTGINVTFEDKSTFTANPSLDDNGQCQLEVEGAKLSIWQVSRRALENLFFAE
jgi:hypothetical protein